MSWNENLQKLSLEVLQERCAEETARYWKSKDGQSDFCFELFRRAILLGNHNVWEIIFEQYELEVKGWVRNHQGFARTGESADYFVNRAFEKFWGRGFSPLEFSRFPNLSSLLSYLKSCVFSVITDYLRTLEPFDLKSIEAHGPTGDLSSFASVEDNVVIQIEKEVLWDLLRAKMKNEQEVLILYDSFVYRLKPREIYFRYNEKFESVEEVYRVKANILSRLRRDDELKVFFAKFAGELE